MVALLRATIFAAQGGGTKHERRSFQEQTERFAIGSPSHHWRFLEQMKKDSF